MPNSVGLGKALFVTTFYKSSRNSNDVLFPTVRCFVAEWCHLDSRYFNILGRRPMT
jgi:hypothetical protein